LSWDNSLITLTKKKKRGKNWEKLLVHVMCWRGRRTWVACATIFNVQWPSSLVPSYLPRCVHLPCAARVDRGLLVWPSSLARRTILLFISFLSRRLNFHAYHSPKYLIGLHNPFLVSLLVLILLIVTFTKCLFFFLISSFNI